MTAIGQMRGLRELLLTFTRPMPTWTRHVAGLAQLETLRVVETSGAAGADFGVLSALPRLRTVDFTATPVGDEAVFALSAVPSLTHVRLTYTDITDTGVAALGAARSLRTLNPSHTR